MHDATYALNSLTYLSADQFKEAFGPTSLTDVLEPLFRNALALHDEFALVVVGWSASLYGFTDLADAIVAEYPNYTRPEFINGREAIVQAIDSLRATSHLPLLQGMLNDPSRAAALFAASAIKDLTGQDVSAQATAQSRPSLPTPSLTAMNAALRSRVVFDTPRGRIVFRMLPDAPITATQFVRITESGAYDGLPVHRVVSNFVAQGGDPHKDGFGHMAWNLPDEPAPTGHGVGYVGLATAGKDTGSCQYFIDLAENFTLDTVYSSFAVVESGLDTAFALQQGDLVSHAHLAY
jgi:cyclophilin family peptidyl-prolyl cis-trans isomerase